MRATAVSICGSKNGSPKELSFGRKKSFTSSVEAKPFRESKRAMHSEPQISFHEITSRFRSSAGDKIQRLCGLELRQGFAPIRFSSTLLGTDHPIRLRI